MIPFKFPDMEIICKQYDGAEQLHPAQCLIDMLDRDGILSGELIDQARELYGGIPHAA
jgi:hypothetical protein